MSTVHHVCAMQTGLFGDTFNTLLSLMFCVGWGKYCDLVIEGKASYKKMLKDNQPLKKLKEKGLTVFW